MNLMSPTDAQIILKGAEASGEDLGIGYRRALETCAGMREYWVVTCEVVAGPTTFKHAEWADSDGHPLTDYTSWLLARSKERAGYENVRIVRRYVLNEEEIS